VAITPARDVAGTCTHLIGSVHDITEIRYAQEEIRKLNTDLEQRVVERTAELEVAKERAESADRLKSAFLATMSHELRTPLNSIIGFTGILMKGIAGPLNDEQLKQLGMAKGSAQHLLALINDVLDISKIEAGELVVSLRKFDFCKVLQDVASSVQPLVNKKNLTLQLNISENIKELYSDERRVGQIFLNLLNNAIKFTDKGHVTIDCEVTDNCIITRVSDTGIGIKKEDMKKLFKPFSQIDTGLTRNHEGTGLGLSICQKRDRNR
jgi:signal transduction histidine kinase